MAIQYIGLINTVRSIGTTNTVSISSSADGAFNTAPYQSGDLGVIFSGFSSSASGTTGVVSPATQNISSLYANDTYDANMNACLYRFTSSAPVTFTYYLQGSANYASPFVMLIFRGVDPTTPLDVLPTATTGINTQYINPYPITPVSGNCAIVAGGLIADASIGAMSTFSSGYTGVAGSAWAGNNSDALLMAEYKILSGGAGVSQDPSAITTTFNTTTASWVSHTIALRPATGRVKYYTGNTAPINAYLPKPVKYWNGSSWVTKPAKYWNGSSWVTTVG